MDGRRYGDDDAGAWPIGPLARQAWRAHDLTRRELAATQRAVRTLDRQGRAPTADGFWEHTALPRAERFAVAVRAAIDFERSLVADHPAGPHPQPAAATSTPPGTPIDELGRWWQRQLRRRAVALALPRLVGRFPAEVELTVAHHEMYLLDRAPWSHGDRLLSAFELAHADIRRYARRQAGRADGSAAGSRDAGGATAGNQVTSSISISR